MDKAKFAPVKLPPPEKVKGKHIMDSMRKKKKPKKRKAMGLKKAC